MKLADGAGRVRASSAIAACVISAVTATYAGVLFSLGQLVSEDLLTLHQTLLSVLFATWFVADSLARQRFSPSFDHGWFVLLVLPVYAPYHLVSTRKWWGVAVCAGMVALFILPWIVQVLIYVTGSN